MSAVQPTLTDPQPDALEVGTTATKAVKGRSRIPWRFLGSRALFYLFTLWAAITINFFLPRMMKGDAVDAYLSRNRNVSPEAADALRALLGLDTDRTLFQQYLDYWSHLLRGDLGVSLLHGLRPVGEVIAGALPWTVGLVGFATIVSFTLGTVGGALIGWRRGSRLDVMIPITTFLSTIPYFWLGLLAIAVFSVNLKWFPIGKAYGVGMSPELSLEFIGQVIRHGTLPALTIVLASLGGWMLGMRNMMLTVLDEDYITVAQAKGMPDRRVLWRYAARNAVLPQIQSFALSLGFIVGGTIVMEMVFSYPGIGKLLLDATNGKDYALMQGVFLVITISVLVANILADVAYAFLDPRTRQTEACPAALENPVVAPPRDTPDEQGFLTKLGSAFAMFRNGKSIAGLVILGVFILVAIFADVIAPASPTAVDPKARLQPPSAEHWLGTTHLGEDVFSQVIFGTRGVIVVGFLAAAIATVIAITVGVISGYISGWKSEALSALTNVFLVIPGLPLIIIVATMFEDPPLWVVAAVLGIIGWAWGARVLRAQTMSLRNRDFVQAARANGEPLRRIIAVEMLPNLMALIAASFVGTVTAAILSLTTLSYIGVIPVTTYNWGTILNWAAAQGAFRQNQWWWYLPPGLCIAAIGVALSLINFGIDEYVNPRLRSAGERARALRKQGVNANSAVTAVRPVALKKEEQK